MIPPRLALLASACVVLGAGSAVAQGKKDRGTRSDFDGMLKESAVGLRLSNGDVENMSPLKLLVDKRKDLKLTDEQQNRLKAIAETLKETNKPHFKALDSLRSEIRPRAGADAEVERIRTQIARETVVGAVKVIRANYATARTEAMAVLDDTQRPKAEELLARQSKDADETLQEKLGPGAGGGGRGGRRGGPPRA